MGILKKVKEKLFGTNEQAINLKSFIGYLCLGSTVATVILLAYGFLALTVIDVESDIAITTLISGMVFMFVAVGLLIAFAKVKPCDESTAKARKQFTKGMGLISLVAITIIAVGIPIYSTVSIGNKFMNELKSYIIGKTFLYDAFEGEDSEIEFTGKKTCIIRYIDRDGYTENVTSENQYKYSIKGKKEDVEIIIGKTKYTYDDDDSFIDEMKRGDKTFRRIGLQDEIEYPSRSSLISSYDNGIRGYSGNTSSGVSDSMYIACAKDLISDTLKNPYSAIFSSTRLVAKDNYGRGIVYLEVTATNSFGAYVTEKYYVCVKNVTSDGKYTHSTVAAYTSVITISPSFLPFTASSLGCSPKSLADFSIEREVSFITDV